MSRRPEHEELEVYQAALTFITWLEPILSAVPESLALAEQLDRASTSIPLNIAEGNSKFTGADRCRYFDNARGSALECAAALDVLVAKGRSPGEDIVPGKDQLGRIVSMLVASIKANTLNVQWSMLGWNA